MINTVLIVSNVLRSVTIDSPKSAANQNYSLYRSLWGPERSAEVVSREGTLSKKSGDESCGCRQVQVDHLLSLYIADMRPNVTFSY